MNNQIFKLRTNKQLYSIQVQIKPRLTSFRRQQKDSICIVKRESKNNLVPTLQMTLFLILGRAIKKVKEVNFKNEY